jgi:hypothetical protein
MFFLAYGGLHWSPDEMLDMPGEQRRWFVERLRLQKEHEAKA